jgi:hypothetical protein
MVFDNRSAQHDAPHDFGDQPRRLHRVTVAGDVPVGVDGRESHVIRATRHVTHAGRRRLRERRDPE